MTLKQPLLYWNTPNNASELSRQGKPALSHLLLKLAAADSPAALPSTAHDTPEAGMIQAPTCSAGNNPFPWPLLS